MGKARRRKKQRARERRAAARHQTTVLELRGEKANGNRKERIAVEPYEAHEGFRRDADAGA